MSLMLILSFNSESDKEKFEYIYNHYRKLLLYKSYEILKDYRLAEDAASEAYIRIYKNIHKIENPKDNKTIAFIVTIVKNVSLTMLKKEKKNITDLSEYDETDSFNLESHIISSMSAGDIYKIVDKLNEELKSVFLYKYAYDMSNKEIGVLMGITENNVRVKLHRAKNKLAEYLQKEGYSYEQA